MQPAELDLQTLLRLKKFKIIKNKKCPASRAFLNNTDTQTPASMPIIDDNRELIELCKSLVANFQQRDDVMNKLVSKVKGME